MSNIILDKIFGENNGFNLDDYKDFLNEVFKQYFNGNISWKLKSNDNKEYHLIKLGTFEDNNGEKMDILVIKSPTRTKVERARVEQRKILSYYLKNTGIFQGVNNLLVVFYSDDEDSNDWRLSFIKQEFKLDEQKKKVVNEFTPAKRKSFLIEQTSKNKTVKDQFNPILEQKESPTISQIEGIFSVEKVTKEFFQEYKKLYSKLKDEFSNDNIFSFINQKYNNGDEYFTENFVKKLMGQIVFLYFIQKKGWLGVSNDKEFGLGEQNYIRKIYDESINGGDSKKENGGKYFFNDYLEHLFYEALNSDRRDKNDWSEYFGCRIPYLNGGLFEPINGYDWSGPQNTILVENKIFGEILDKFDLYNFTIYENDPLEQDVAVDPEMLGKIFENLLPDNERKGKGAFYTPREIVHYMTRESLINHIITDTGIEEEKVRKLFEYKDAMIFKKDNDNKLTDKEKFDIFDEFEPYAKNIDKSLENIKIVDPAVGSGAFPMGLLQEIVGIRYYIRENILLDDSLSLYNLKKQTLENCIYGVDIDPGAVEIAKLRFWLSLVVENDTDKIDPLPNLDYKIMQGNSLLEDLIIGESSISLITDKDLGLKRTSKDKDAYMRGATLDFLNFDELLNKLKYLHKKFFKETNNIQKKQIKLELDQIEKDLIRRKCEEEVNRIQSQIDNIQIKYTLSGQGYTDKDAKLIAKYFDDISKIKDVEKKFEKDNIRPFFPWKLHFGEIFIEKGGFDIVIGNPPYVQLQKDNGYLGKLFEKVGFQTYAKTGDIYGLFYEFSFRLLKQGGISTFITSNKWMRAGYGQSLRKFFVKNTNPLILIDLGAGVFETATVDTNILISKNEKVKNFQLKALDLTKQKQIGKIEDYKDRFVEINSLTDDVWSILNPLQQNIKNKIEKIGTPLKDWNIKIYRGVLTGFNEAFIIDGKKKDELIQADPKNAEIIKPILRGRDIRKYYCDFADLWLIFIPWHFPLHKDPLISGNSKEAELEFQKQYTVIYNHLLQYKKQLSNRNKEETGIRYEWYVLQRCAASYYEEFEKDKIVWSETGQKIKMTIAEGGIYLDKTCFMLIGNHLKYICSIFNSKIIDFFARSNLCGLGENGLSLKKTDMELIPIPHVSKPQQEPFIDMVDKILAITSKEDYNPKDLNSDDVQQVKKYERQIDVMVYKLYELTYDEVLVVDPEFWLSKEEYESFSW